MRIVSLLPAATEIVCALGLEDQLVGVTHECDFPHGVRDLPKVTRSLIPTAVSSGEIDRLVRERRETQQALYILDLPLLQQLEPELIVTQALCDVCAVAEDEVNAAACALPGMPRVLNLEPRTLWEVFDSIGRVARAAGVPERSARVVQSLTRRVDIVIGRSVRVAHTPRVAFLEWLDPPFSCGHWTPELVLLAGGFEGLAKEGDRSRTLAWTEVIAYQPEVVVIACCGFDVERTLGDLPLLDAVDGWHDTPAVRAGRVYVIDGSQYFSRPGPRLVDGLEILAHCLHPELHTLPNGVSPALHVEPPMVAAHH